MPAKRTRSTNGKLAKKKTPSRPANPRGEGTRRKVVIEVWDSPPPSPLRGLLPTPPEVVEIVDEWLKDRPASPAARLRITEGLKMQYYFGGHNYAYRDTPNGREVLAAGEEEIRKLFKRLPETKHLGIIIGYADPW